MKLRKFLLLFSLVFVAGTFFSCSLFTGEEPTLEQPISFHITDGACGEVIFEEAIGTDSLSAVEIIKQREIEFLGHDNFTIESTLLKVEDKNGNIPQQKFFVLHILNEENLLLHAASEVITSEGDLFTLIWCPD